MKGSSLYGKLNLNRGGQANRPDGRAKSSAFQKDTDPKDKDAKNLKEWKKENKDFGIGWSGKEYKEQMNEPVVKNGKTTSGSEIQKSKAYKSGDYKDTRGTLKKGWDSLTQIGQGIKGALTEGKTAYGEYQKEKTLDKVAGLQNTKASNKKASSGGSKEFNAAFGKADKAGLKTFTYKGKSYTTKKKGAPKLDDDKISRAKKAAQGARSMVKAYVEPGRARKAGTSIYEDKYEGTGETRASRRAGRKISKAEKKIERAQELYAKGKTKRAERKLKSAERKSSKARKIISKRGEGTTTRSVQEKYKNDPRYQD